MRGSITCAALIAVALLAAAPRIAAAADEPVALAAGPGRDLTIGRCIICHSLEYIPSNAPAMDRNGWQKTIQKMKDRFGAPITDEESQEILDYLDAHYSAKT